MSYTLVAFIAAASGVIFGFFICSLCVVAAKADRDELGGCWPVSTIGGRI